MSNQFLYIKSILCSLLLLMSTAAIAQEVPVLKPESEKNTEESSPIKVKNSDNFIFERVDDVDMQYYNGNVKIFQDSIFFTADSAVIQDEIVTAVGEVIIIQDTTNVFADSLHYNSETKLARLSSSAI